MKILKTKDSEIMNLYFNQQLKKEASALFDAFLEVAKKSVPGGTLADIAALMKTTVDDLVTGTGRSADELSDIIKVTSKEVITPEAIKALQYQFARSRMKFLAIAKEAQVLVERIKNLESLDDQAIRQLRADLAETKSKLQTEYTISNGAYQKMVSGGALSQEERLVNKKILDTAREQLKALADGEKKVISKIEAPNASSVSKVEPPKAATPSSPKTTEPTLLGQVKPFAKPVVSAEAEAAEQIVKPAIQMAERELPDIGKKYAELAISEARKAAGFLDKNSEALIGDIIYRANQVGMHNGLIETIELMESATGKTTVDSLNAAIKADQAAASKSLSKLPPKAQKVVADIAEKAKLDAKASSRKAFDKATSDAISNARSPNIKPISPATPAEPNIPSAKGPAKSPEPPKAPEAAGPDISTKEKIDEQRLKRLEDESLARAEEKAEKQWQKSFMGQITEKVKTALAGALVVGMMGIGPLVYAAIAGVTGMVVAGITGLGGAVGSVAAVAMPLVALLAAAGGAYYLYNNWAAEDTNAEILQDMQSSLTDAYAKIQTVKFKENTDGERISIEISSIIRRLNTYGPSVLSGKANSSEDLQAIWTDIDKLDEYLIEFFSSRDKYCQDLVNPNECDDLIKSLIPVYSAIQKYKSEISKYMIAHAGEESASGVGGIQTPVGSAAKPAAPGAETPERLPYPVQVYDQTIDLSHIKDPNIRMSAPRIIGKVFNSPEGMAFLDPANKFGGGYHGRTDNPQADYIEAIKYFYLNRIFDRHDLRKFIRTNLPTASRRRMGTYKEGLDYYRQHPFSTPKIRRRRLKKQENLKNLHKNFEKSANVSPYVDKSGNQMDKQADQFSKEYFKDAVKSISDQYSKSYFEGFGKLYDVTPEKTSADYQQLYQTHQETGSDLIQQAHPKSVYIADAIQNGGLIENSIEQHRKFEEIAHSMPSGNFRNRYAELIENLVKIANEADEQGLYQSSELIEESLTKIIDNLK